MSWNEKLAGEAEDPAVAQALRDFKASVDAWSEAEMSQSWTAVSVVRHSWRLAAAWALGCVLATGSVTAGIYQHRHQQALDRIAAAEAAQKAEEARLAAQQPGQNEDQDLLATVDNDISRAVPAAMEPLAQMMDNSGTE